jgi:hypothetical protein
VIDAFMMFTVYGGFALCAAYFRAQYMDWRQEHAADLKEKVRVRLFYQVRFSRGRKSVGAGAVVDVAVGDSAGSPAYPGRQSRSVERYMVFAHARPFSTAPFPPRVLGINRNRISDRVTSR